MNKQELDRLIFDLMDENAALKIENNALRVKAGYRKKIIDDWWKEEDRNVSVV